MAKPPFFPFYYQDFLTGTRFFTNAQTGAYIRLLLDQWDLDILKEKHFFARMNGISQEECNEIRVKFKPVSLKGVAGFQNERMEETRKYVSKIGKIRSESGKLGGLAKAKQNTKQTDSKTPSKTVANQGIQILNPNPNPNIKDKIKSTLQSEEKGVSKKPQKPLTTWPRVFELTESMKAYGQKKGVKNPDDEFEAFRNWADQNEKQFRDWPAAWRTRCDNYLQFSGKKPNTEDRYA